MTEITKGGIMLSIYHADFIENHIPYFRVFDDNETSLISLDGMMMELLLIGLERWCDCENMHFRLLVIN